MDLLRQLGEQLRLGNTSVHLAVRLLDLFMDNHRVETAHLSLVALGCLLLASQWDVVLQASLEVSISHLRSSGELQGCRSAVKPCVSQTDIDRPETVEAPYRCGRHSPMELQYSPVAADSSCESFLPVACG